MRALISILVLLVLAAVLLLPRLRQPDEPREETPPETVAPEPELPSQELLPPEPPPLPDWPADSEPPPTFSGMARVPAGTFLMGVDEGRLARRLAAMPQLSDKEKWWPVLLLETPEHEAETDAYAIDRLEVTNAQYEVFLRETSLASVSTSMQMDTLTEVAAKIFGEVPAARHMATIYWMNRERLLAMQPEVLAANENLVRALLTSIGVTRFEDLEVEKQIEAWAEFRLDAGVDLRTYTRTIPLSWTEARVSDEIANLPVDFVSGADADDFAAWAGKHVPTEEEWEKAARGPEGFLYPWGDEWDPSDPEQRNRLYWSGTDSPPAPDYEDKPLPVDTMPEGQSPYGCYHMLGNVMEWTSSHPRKYPRSDAESNHFGNRRARVLRGLAFGDGLAFKDMELKFRNTARVLEGPSGAIYPSNRWEAVGFRCAKYLVPARDALLRAFRRVKQSGLDRWLRGMDPMKGFGVEHPHSAPPGEEGRGKVFVRGRTEAIGFVPGKDLRGPIFGWVHWTPGLEVEGSVRTESVLFHEDGYLLGQDEGRLALFRMKIKGPERVALLPDPHTFEEEEARSATIEPDGFSVRFRWKRLSFRLRIGALWKPEWRET